MFIIIIKNISKQEFEGHRVSQHILLIPYKNTASNAIIHLSYQIHVHFNSNIQSRMILVKNKISNLDLCSIQHKKCISIYRVLRLPRKRKLDLCSLNDSTESKVLKEFNENQKVQKRA